jgi:hypothetical protein
LKGGSTSRVMAADRPYGEFYDFDIVSQEYFGYTLLVLCDVCIHRRRGGDFYFPFRCGPTRVRLCRNEDFKSLVLLNILLMFFLFLGPCIFKRCGRINQQNAQLNPCLICYCFNYSNMFRPLFEAIIRGSSCPCTLQTGAAI